ncbi:hypothetical protein ACIHDR_11595 [Nocardia sp. NPDC052278]|uniref:hypothetical protein n=1 Tax=unclassified Nocardia TaxID=2637762 RepID=UPI00367E4898
MVRFANRKRRIRSLMTMYPGITYGEAARRAEFEAPSKFWQDWPEPGGPEAEITGRCGHHRLRQLLTDAVGRIDDLPPTSPTVIWLAHCHRGFVAAGYVSERLHWYAVVPSDDFYSTVHRACRAAAAEIESAVGPHLADKYSPRALLRDSDMFEHVAWLWAGLELDLLAEPMAHLGRHLHHLLKVVAEDESAPPALRNIAAVTAPTAEMVHLRYGSAR